MSEASTETVPERLTLTVDEAADLLGLSRASAYAGVQAGTIPSIRVGRRILVPKAALLRMLEAAAATPEAPAA